MVYHFAPWSGWRADVPGFALFSLCMAEMFVFFVEDGTTVLIWQVSQDGRGACLVERLCSHWCLRCMRRPACRACFFDLGGMVDAVTIH